MTLAYIAEIGLIIRKTDIGAEKVDGSALETYRMVIVDFLVLDRLKNVQLFEMTFLLANTSMEVVLRMHFFTLFDIYIWFVEKKLT